MIFDINAIYGEGLDFEVLEPKKHFSIDSPDCYLTEDVKVQGTLEKTGLEVLCKGSLETSLSVTCTRCLDNFDYPVKSQFQVHFMPKPGDDRPGEEIELTDLDCDQEFYEEDRINLTGPVRDLILLSLPQIRLCREDCEGLCPQCGIKLSENSCSCDRLDSCDPRLAMLQKLKDKLK